MSDGQVHDLSRAIGGLEEAVDRLTHAQDKESANADRRHKEVTESIAAVSTSHRTLAADVEALEHDVDEMKPLVNDYRENRDQARGAAKFAKFVWAGMIALGAAIAQVVDWFMSHLPKVVLIAVLLGVAVIAYARADGGGTQKPLHQHPPQDAEIHYSFYSTWMRPDQPWVSCCDRKDCAPVKQVRRIGDRWEALRESDEQWVVVPPAKVEQRRDSPDGRSHLCSRGLSVFCFVAGSGT